jgi:hypothetical protein
MLYLNGNVQSLSSKIQHDSPVLYHVEIIGDLASVVEVIKTVKITEAKPDAERKFSDLTSDEVSAVIQVNVDQFVKLGEIIGDYDNLTPVVYHNGEIGVTF